MIVVNIVESYGGITTPLTFSFIRNVYENVYIELCKIFKISNEKIEMNSEMFQNMLALIDGRVYYNLYGWYGILTMFPGLGSNKKFMESMMGVKESLPENLFPVPQQSLKDKLGLVNSGIGLLGGFMKLKKMTNNFYKRLNDALDDRDLNSMDLYDLHDYYYELESKLLHKWDAPLVNDFLVMIFYGMLKSKCTNIFAEEGDRVYNDLLCDEGNIISAEPARRIKEMAKMAVEDRRILELLENDDILYIQKSLTKYKDFNKKLNEYLDKFSGRCLEELKLETLTLRENPKPLYSSISSYARRMLEGKFTELDGSKIRREAERKVFSELQFNPIKKANFKYVLKQTRYTVRNRENLRFERTRVFGRVREIFLRIGYILASMNIIEEQRDIFYLEVNEILFYIDGKSTTNNLKELIAIRKFQYNKYKETLPDDRFYSYGAVNVGNGFRYTPKSSSSSKSKNKETKLKGIGASPGKVTGRARVIRNPTNAKIEKGEILVAEFTDPGWIMLFPSSSAILVERGSLLSHSAIVSRELGIPAVVGITGLLNNIGTGDLVSMDGTTGEVELLKKFTIPDTTKITNVKNLLEYIEFHNSEIYPNIKYKQFIKNVEYTANWILKNEYKHVAILSDNSMEYEKLIISTMASGSISIPIDVDAIFANLENIIIHDKLDIIFYSKKYEELLIDCYNELKETYPTRKLNHKFICIGSDEYRAIVEEGKKISVAEDLLAEADVQDNSVATIIHTSGTTGIPKGIELTHKNIIQNILNTRKILHLNNNDVVLSYLPLYHVLEGIFSLFNSIIAGSKRIIVTDPATIPNVINSNKVTFMCGVPELYKYLYHELDNLKVKPYFFSAGAPLSIDLQSSYAQKGFTLFQGYGMTETASAVTLDNKDHFVVGSCGKPLENIEIDIRNADSDFVGEIWVRTPNLYLDYIQKGDNYKNYYTIGNGWYNTGDMGYVTEDGYLYLSGRKSNIIILSNGKKILPEDLENKIGNINFVKECIVYNNPYSGEEASRDDIFAVICCAKENCNYIQKEIEKLNRDLDNDLKIKHISFSDLEFPKNELGKIRREEVINQKDKMITRNLDFLLKKYDSFFDDIDEDRFGIEESNANMDTVKKIIAKKLNLDEEDLDSSLDFKQNLGADSLDKLEIIAEIEKELNIKIPKEEYNNINTISDLNKYM